MRLSIAIPVYNGERFLEQALASALEQSRPFDEVLVVDDNSTDRSAAIARSLRWAGRVTYRFNQVPTGFADAWNRAAAWSTGDFVTVLHQDDLLDRDYLESIEAAAQRYPQAGHLYAACRYIDANGHTLRMAPVPHSAEPVLYSGTEYAHRYLQGVLANAHIHRCPGVTTRRDLLTGKCAYRKEAGHIADDDFFYRIGAFTEVVGISRPLASYREHEASTTARLSHLELTLAQDWVFQVVQHVGRASLITQNDQERIVQQAVKMLNRALVLAIGERSSREIHACQETAAALERALPGSLAKHSPRSAKLIWRSLRSTGEVSCLTSAYVGMLLGAIRVRTALRGL